MSPNSQPEVLIRAATSADAPACGKICYDAFSTLSAKHGFPCDLPGPEAARDQLGRLFSDPGFYSVVAESGGRIVGSNCLDDRSLIAGIGPITVDPGAQNAGVGRKLMEAVMQRARERQPAGMRLVQAAYHNRSLSLYSTLGFDVREPLSCIQGQPVDRLVPGCVVRQARLADVEPANTLAFRVHGFRRGAELTAAVGRQTARVVERDGRITGYATVLGFLGHGTAETALDLQALIGSAESFAGPGILVPSRNSELLRWCLASGLHVVQPMTLMSIGLYNEPAGAWFPSVLF